MGGLQYGVGRQDQHEHERNREMTTENNCPDGESRRLHHRKGYFELSDPQVDLVHHWDISLAFGDEESGRQVIAELKSRRLLVDGENENMSRLSPANIITWINEHFSGVSVEDDGSTPYTLNEQEYLAHLRWEVAADNSENVGVQLIFPAVQEQHRAVERDIALNETELRWVTRGIIHRMFDATEPILEVRDHACLESIRYHMGKEGFDEEYFPLYRERLGQIADRELQMLGGDAIEYDVEFWSGFADRWLQTLFHEDSDEELEACGHLRPFEPTKADLEEVLDGYRQNPNSPGREERVAVIKNAISCPRWLDEWPYWEQMSRDMDEVILEREIFLRHGVPFDSGAQPRPADADATEGNSPVPEEREETASPPIQVMMDEEFLRSLAEMCSSTRESSLKVDWKREGF
jgi:hypothetical protein